MRAIRRREFLSGAALAAGSVLFTSRIAFAGSGTRPRFVFIILRGALDGLTAVPPYADPNYARLRGEVAVAAPGAAGGALKLDGLFGLHPSLVFLNESFAARELVVFHAVASPYRERSHFDGQDVLENGCARAHAVQTGWINRALATLPPDHSARRGELGIALGQNVPLVMRGTAPVASWSPSHLAALDEDTLQRITDLYSTDPILSQRLADALATQSVADASQEEAMTGAAAQDSPAQLLARREQPKARGAAPYKEIIHATAGFLRSDDGPRVAVFDALGWDTHANEGGAQGQLAARLAGLDAGLRLLKEDLGPVWRDTVVMIATEFGRTAAVNGTRGTDHGTAAAAFLLGGAVHGGRVIADWPGLSERALYQGRDLAPTLNLHSIMKGVLADHLAVPARALDTAVFPDSAAAKPVPGLLRA
ncbi:MAG TPA: DUF1501 domain-containing protein [Steroidobacteraceae bacterium]|jgi:uncharacterized protein (DUF1501 family)|nr:DUF1501 domain-containing protein [Steroidobacteraceae bacterium]